MHIVSARITGFRNLADADLSFAPGVNLVLGPNGQGKTNLLEALHFVALGRSHRGARHDDLVAFGGQALHVTLTVQEHDPERTVVFEYGIERGGGRRFKVDGETLQRRSELVGRFAAVYFDPETVRLVREGPEHRRRFVDGGLSQIDAAYLADLAAYHRALRQKSQILRDVKRRVRDPGEVRDEAAAWNREMARHATGVVLGRAAYAALLGPAGESAHRAVTGDDRELSFAYRPAMESVREYLARTPVTEANENTIFSAPADPPENAQNQELERDISAEFDYIWPDELRRGRPLIGPHRDDFDVRLSTRSLRTFGSQGETRTAAVALILAQSAVVHQRRRVRPVLFLDDIFSELDRDRARRLQELAANDHQLFVATARRDDVAGWTPRELAVWTVRDGALTRE
jgi:DNA replication and repair protein RecF